MSKSYILPIDRTLSGATTPGQSGPGSGSNEGVLFVPQSSSITEASPSDGSVSYKNTRWGSLTLCRDAVGVFCSSSQLWPQDTRWGSLTLCRDAVGEFCSSSQLWPQDTRWGSLTLCRDAVGVFCSSSQLGQHPSVWKLDERKVMKAISVFPK